MAKVVKNLRLPAVAVDAENDRVVITLNGDEDEFVVLQMAGGVAGELTQKLIAAGFDRRPR